MTVHTDDTVFIVSTFDPLLSSYICGVLYILQTKKLIH